jgi:hypothetical protein
LGDNRASFLTTRLLQPFFTIYLDKDIANQCTLMKW